MTVAVTRDRRTLGGVGSRDIILKRRARFVAASLAAAGLVVTSTVRAEDGGEDASVDASDAADDAGPPQICLSAPKPEDPANPEACLCACAIPESDLSMGPAAGALAAAAVLAVRRRKRPR